MSNSITKTNEAQSSNSERLDAGQQQQQQQQQLAAFFQNSNAMQQLEEEDGENPSQRILQDGGRREGVSFSKQFSGLSQLPRKLAEHSLKVKGHFTKKGFIFIILFLCLLNLFLTLRHTSEDYQALQLQQSANLEKFRVHIDSVWKNFTEDTMRKLEQQGRQLQKRTQNETEAGLKIAEEKTRQLTQQIEALLDETNNLKMQFSSCTNEIKELRNNVTGQIQILDDWAKNNLTQSVKTNRMKLDGLKMQLQSAGLATTNHTDVGERLELTQEIWREGRASLVLSHEIFQEHLENSSTALKQILETFKTSPEGRKFNLSENKILFDLLYETTKTENICGGSFNMSEPSLFRYESSSSNNNDVGRPCIWVMWTVLASSMKVRLLDLSGNVTIYESITQDTDGEAIHTWTTSDLFKEITISSNIAVVVFTPQPSTSSRDLMEIGFRFGDVIPTAAEVTVSTLTADSTTRRIDGYGGRTHNERSYTFIYPPADGKVRVEVELVNVEQGPDYLLVFKYSNETRQFDFVRKFTGVSYINPVFEGYTNQPMLLYFHTDVSIASEGYRATYRSTS